MKKILAVIFSVFLGFASYAAPWEEALTSVTKFLSEGGAVFYHEDKNNVIIFPKNQILRITMDEDDFKIYISDDEDEDYQFKVNKHKVEVDDSGNLIITNK
ncbi:MAG: hypothetical protein IJ727_06610 [Treponema sp.]|nr:hypothetical protein [Treponema sp.]